MARGAKAKTSDSVESTPVSVQSVPASSDMAVAAPKAPKAKKVKAPKEEAGVSVPVSVAPVDVTPVVDVAGDAPVDGEVPLTEQSLEFIAKLSQLGLSYHFFEGGLPCS